MLNLVHFIFIFTFRLITKLPIFDLNSKKLTDIELVEKSLNQLKEEYVIIFILDFHLFLFLFILHQEK